MRKSSSFTCFLITVVLGCLACVSIAVADTGSVVDLSEWDVTSYKVNLTDHRGGSGDIQQDQNGWIHLGANHLEGGDIQYEVLVGQLSQADILEVWIDGYSTSTDLDIGPTVFIGTGKNRFEQITRVSRDAWRPFVFRFADDALYGDVTDPSNRNANWRVRYPSSKYEVRRIDKSPASLLDYHTLPLRISMTGAEDFIIKRLEVVVYRAQHGFGRGGVYIVNLSPYTIQRGGTLDVELNKALPDDAIDFYVIDPDGEEYKVVPRILNAERDNVAFYAEAFWLTKSGQYQLKLVDRSVQGEAFTDVERFEYRRPRPTPRPTQPPDIVAEDICEPPCPPGYLPPVPQGPPPYVIPGQIDPVLVPPSGPGPILAPPVMPQPQPQPQPVGRYSIQLGAFRTYSAAVALMNKIQRFGAYNVQISEIQKGTQRLFRVRIGPYPSKALASQDASRLKRNGFDTWITESS